MLLLFNYYTSTCTPYKINHFQDTPIQASYLTFIHQIDLNEPPAHSHSTQPREEEPGFDFMAHYYAGGDLSTPPPADPQPYSTPEDIDYMNKSQEEEDIGYPEHRPDDLHHEPYTYYDQHQEDRYGHEDKHHEPYDTYHQTDVRHNDYERDYTQEYDQVEVDKQQEINQDPLGKYRRLG